MQPSYSLRTFAGHSGSVMSLDFHPKGGDLICSCDGKNEIRYWSIKKGGCARVLQVQARDRLYIYGLQKIYVKTVNFRVFPGIEYILFPNYSG